MKAVVQGPSEDFFPLYDITVRLTRTLTVLTDVPRRFLQPLEKIARFVFFLVYDCAFLQALTVSYSLIMLSLDAVISGLQVESLCI